MVRWSAHYAPSTTADKGLRRNGRVPFQDTNSFRSHFVVAWRQHKVPTGASAFLSLRHRRELTVPRAVFQRHFTFNFGCRVGAVQKLSFATASRRWSSMLPYAPPRVSSYCTVRWLCFFVSCHLSECPADQTLDPDPFMGCISCSENSFAIRVPWFASSWLLGGLHRHFLTLGRELEERREIG